MYLFDIATSVFPNVEPFLYSRKVSSFSGRACDFQGAPILKLTVLEGLELKTTLSCGLHSKDGNKGSLIPFFSKASDFSFQH